MANLITLIMTATISTNYSTLKVLHPIIIKMLGLFGSYNDRLHEALEAVKAAFQVDSLEWVGSPTAIGATILGRMLGDEWFHEDDSRNTPDPSLDMSWWFRNLDALADDIEVGDLTREEYREESFLLLRHLLYWVAVLPNHDVTVRMLTCVEEDWEVFFACGEEILAIAHTARRPQSVEEARIVALLGWLVEEMAPVVGAGDPAETRVGELLATASS